MKADLASSRNRASVAWFSTPAVSAVALACIVSAAAVGSRPEDDVIAYVTAHTRHCLTPAPLNEEVLCLTTKQSPSPDVSTTLKRRSLKRARPSL